MTAKLSRDFAFSTLERDIGVIVVLDERFCNMVVTLIECTYLGDRLRIGGGCVAAVTTRTICGWVKFMECGELLYGRFPLRQKEAVYMSYVRSMILFGRGIWCLRESEMEILRRQ